MPQQDLLERFRAGLPDLQGQRLCLAYSGGLDSTVLLHLLARLAPEAGFVLSALHVHHGLSHYAEDWARHCEGGCARLGVPLHVRRVQVERHAGKGLEAAAREARHAAFAEMEADWIVLAHHADDQAETLLHRLLRGSGLAGAAAMRERCPERRLWRPLLAETRARLKDWACAQGLVWIDDDSNADEALTRNFLRRQIMGRIAGRMPAGAANMARACGHFAEADGLLRELAELDLAKLAIGQAGARARLRQFSVARARNLLRYCLSLEQVLMPSAVRLERLLQDLRGHAALRLPLEKGFLCAYRDELWKEPFKQALPCAQDWHGELELPWGAGALRLEPAVGGGALSLDPAADNLRFCPRAGGERMRLAQARPLRALKLLCQEHGIPPWWREQMPLLWRGDDLLWVGGIGPAAGTAAPSGEKGWRLAWLGPDGVWR